MVPFDGHSGRDELINWGAVECEASEAHPEN